MLDNHAGIRYNIFIGWGGSPDKSGESPGARPSGSRSGLSGNRLDRTWNGATPKGALP